MIYVLLIIPPILLFLHFREKRKRELLRREYNGKMAHILGLSLAIDDESSIKYAHQGNLGYIISIYSDKFPECAPIDIVKNDTPRKEDIENLSKIISYLEKKHSERIEVQREHEKYLSRQYYEFYREVMGHD